MEEERKQEALSEEEIVTEEDLTTKETKESKEVKKPNQDDEFNAKMARERREKERRDKELKDAYEKGKSETLNNMGATNKFTQSKITDDFDLEIYKLQQEIEKNGDDPIKDLPKYLASRNRQKAIQEQEEQKKKQEESDSINKDIADFSKAYPSVNVKELLDDENFADYSFGKLGTAPLKEIYQKYLSFRERNGLGDKDKELDKLAKQKSSGPSSQTKKKQDKSYKEYTDEEVLDNLRKRGIYF